MEALFLHSAKLELLVTPAIKMAGSGHKDPSSLPRDFHAYLHLQGNAWCMCMMARSHHWAFIALICIFGWWFQIL